MPEMFPFAREDVFPSWFADRIQDFLSAAETNLRLSRKNATTVQVIPDTALGIAAVDLQGRWRFNEATTEREHPGGAKATYTVWAVAEDNDVDDTPKPHTDHTNYAFTLRITSGANPSGSGVEVFEKIGEIDWSGTEIEAVRQTLNSVTGPMIADGALAGTGDIEWKREPSGAWVPQLKTDSVTAAEIAAGAVGASEVNNELKPSAGAAAGTEALRAIGTTASTAAAGNDARLTDERTPKNTSVTAAKIGASAVTEEKISDGAVTARKYKPTTGIKRGTGAEGTISGVGATRIEPGILFNQGYSAKLFCIVTAFFKEEGAAAGTQIGVASYEVGKFSVKSEAKAPGETVGEGGDYFSTVGTLGTGWHFVTAAVTLELAAAEREVFMAIWPLTVGGGNVTKYLPKAWCVQWMLMKA